ncbi:MAG TPA: DpnI domain-containing protein, partial [Nitrospirota bacterium]
METSIYFPEAFEKYNSPSQRVRVMSERWLETNMYCPACSSNHLSAHSNNTTVRDFFCPKCDEQFQLKCMKRLGGKVTDGAYQNMITAVLSGGAPNFLFLNYAQDFSVANLLLVPGFFFSESIIEKRKPLSNTARRAGWVGCNILVRGLAEEGRIKIVDSGAPVHKNTVREEWKRIGFMKEIKPAEKGWINDI